MKFSWGTGITVSYLLFVLLILGFLAFAMGQDVNLVSSDYYEQELKYEDKIEKINRANQLHEKIKLEMADNNLSITFPDLFDPEEINGHITLYRPSDRQEDKVYEINLRHEDRKQEISIYTLKNGLWRVKLDWEIDGAGYYFEKNIIVE